MYSLLIHDFAPIGSIISWSDGTPRPPKRFARKLIGWKTSNSSGRLIRKQGARYIGNHRFPACFTIHESDYGSQGTIVLRVHRTFDVENSGLTFVVVERPPVGSCRLFDRAGEGAELVHLAASRAAAEDWLTRHGYPRAVLEEVVVDGIEGRAAA